MPPIGSNGTHVHVRAAGSNTELNRSTRRREAPADRAASSGARPGGLMPPHPGRKPRTRSSFRPDSARSAMPAPFLDPAVRRVAYVRARVGLGDLLCTV